jgi:hypothetical protein
MKQGHASALRRNNSSTGAVVAQSKNCVQFEKCSAVIDLSAPSRAGTAALLCSRHMLRHHAPAS